MYIIDKFQSFNESFSDGESSHYNSLLTKWAEKYNVKFEWKFKEVKGKRKPYFALNLTYDEYIALPSDAKTELNKLNRQFRVDFEYNRSGYWTPVIS